MQNNRKREVFHFVTFAGGSANFYEAGNRILTQAQKSELFTSNRLFTESDVNEINQEVSCFIEQNRYGLGFWIWKPTIIKYCLEDYVQENEYLVYVDAGCELASNWLSKKKFKNFCAKNLDQDILAFSTDSPEFHWTKSSVLELLNQEAFKFTTHVAATFIIFRKSKTSCDLVNAWLNICTMEDGRFIDNTIGEELVNFIEHRYDQSIFSVIYKNAGFKSFELQQPSYSMDPPKVSLINRMAYSGYLIWPIRNRSGNPILLPGKKITFQPLFSPIALLAVNLGRISTTYLKLLKCKITDTKLEYFGR